MNRLNIEEAVIGTLFKESHLLNDTPIKPEHFQSIVNRRTFEAMKQLQQQGKGIDVFTLLSIGDPKEIMPMGKINDVSRLSNPSKIDSYVDIVVEKWRDREKVELLHTATRDGWSIDKITSQLGMLVDDKTDDRRDIRDLMAEVYESPWIEKVHIDSVNVGMDNLQEITNGLRDSELTFIGARPSMGKTDVMLHVAKTAGYNGYVPILHSLEMSAESLRDRLIAGEGRINRHRMSDPHKLLGVKQKDEWSNTISRVGNTNMVMFDKARQSVAEIRMKTRKVRNENPDKKIIVFIDYLTLIKPDERSGHNVHHQVSDITKDLKELAKEFVCPVVCLAQLSRDIERRPDKRPLMSDLRESGGIEEAGDVIMFLYREAYYDPDTPDYRTMEINVAKQRNGATGTVFVDYDKSTGVLM